MSIFEDLGKLVQNIDGPDAVTRKHVGLKKTAPFVKGYWYLYIDLPIVMKDELKYPIESWRKLFSGLSINFSPPSKNLNFADMSHLTGSSKHFTNMTKNNDFSITYNELSGRPIHKFHLAWQEVLAQSGLGLGAVDIPYEYKTQFLVIQTRPIGTSVNGNFQFKPEHIEQVFLLLGVAPPSDDQTGSFDSDITGPGLVQLSYSYTCDDWYTDFEIPELKTAAANILNNKIFKWTVFNDLVKLYKNQEMTGGLFSG